jgi:ribonuclease P protein component
MPASAPSFLGDRPRLQVLASAEEFKRAMAQPSLAKTPHFVVHHLLSGVQVHNRVVSAKWLSSNQTPSHQETVDNSFENTVDKLVNSALQTAWAGYVVPKRYARRAVTRNLIRRQMRQLLEDQRRTTTGLPNGIWVLRLRQGFDKSQFPSAASTQLKHAVRDELTQLLSIAVRRLQERAARA